MQAGTRHILITGASSGLGQALATVLAAPGVVLHLAGRQSERLAASAALCRNKGAVVEPAVIDVRDRTAMEAWISALPRLDLVIANAGISAGTGGALEPAEQARRIFETNLGGVLNTVLPALAVMAAQPPDATGLRGRIAVIASVAAFVPAPPAPAYCASKAAVRVWAEALAASERRRGIRIHVVCPGYVRTAMTAHNPFPMPLLMEAEAAARRILAGLARGRVRIAFPWPIYLAARLLGALPPALLARLFAQLPAKPPLP